MNTRQRILAISCIVLFAAGCVESGNGMDKVNGNVAVPTGAHGGKASTVNGSIDIGHDASVAKAATVNGDISLGPHARADTLVTVNGGIRIDDGVQIARNVTSVNGALRMAAGSHVGGRLENVNGDIELDHASVDGGIQTVSGDITIGSGSIVRGGLHVEKPNGISFGISHKPRIVIESGAQVDDVLQFDREVDLFVAADAKIGKVIGATAQPYSGK